MQLTLQQKDNMIEDLNSKIEELKGEKDQLNKAFCQSKHSAMQVDRRMKDNTFHDKI